MAETGQLGSKQSPWLGCRLQNGVSGGIIIPFMATGPGGGEQVGNVPAAVKLILFQLSPVP